MLYAVRGNKQLKIEETDRRKYLSLGYDIAKEEDGKLEIVQHAPSKTVSYARYEKLENENAELKAQLAAANKKVKELEKKSKDADQQDSKKQGE